MNLNNIFFIKLLLFTFCFSSLNCFAQEAKKFPEVKTLDAFPKTEFLPTLEHPIVKDKNCIYAASLLFAWDEIRKAVGEPIVIDKKYLDLTLLNDSKSYHNVLKPNEYKTSVSVEGFKIVAKAEFKKSLPFETKLDDLQSYVLKFDNLNVQSFGLKTYETEKLNSFVILYYQDDDNFIIKLKPKDKEHEIILFKSTLDSFSTLIEKINTIVEKIELGKKEILKEDKKWCYEFQTGDTLMIPKLKFNIEHNYNNLTNNNFAANIGKCTISKAYQKTAFQINQDGAEIESEAGVVLSWGKKRKADKKIKVMMFDKPFLLVMKRVDNKNPYFAMWVANAELMEKEEK